MQGDVGVLDCNIVISKYYNQEHQRLLAFVVHIIDTMHLLGITFIL